MLSVLDARLELLRGLPPDRQGHLCFLFARRDGLRARGLFRLDASGRRLSHGVGLGHPRAQCTRDRRPCAATTLSQPDVVVLSGSA